MAMEREVCVKRETLQKRRCVSREKKLDTTEKMVVMVEAKSIDSIGSSHGF